MLLEFIAWRIEGAGVGQVQLGQTEAIHAAAPGRNVAARGVAMKTAQEFPKHLLEATRYFSNPDVCVEFVASIRWPNGITCPHCEGTKLSFLTSRRLWKCMAKDCHAQFSVKTGGIFESSSVALDKWLTAVWLVVNSKNGVSSYEIMRYLGVTQMTGWYMLHRIRLALKRLPDAELSENAGEKGVL